MLAKLLYYHILITAVVIGSYFFLPYQRLISIIIVLCFLCLPLIVLHADKKNRIIFLKLSFLWISGIIFVAFLFRSLRNVLPPPAIDYEKIVGYSQYFGYPLASDFITYFILLLLPIISAALLAFFLRP